MDGTGSETGQGKIYYSNFAKNIFKEICYSSNDNLISYQHRNVKNISATNVNVTSATTMKRNCLTSLKHLALNFIAQNMSLVDSFVGLPDIIGKEIFDAYFSLQSLQSLTCQDWVTVFNVFCEAYSYLVLETLNLSGKYLFVNLEFESILCFTNLKAIDLSNCKIGDSHPILVQLHSFHDLEYLSLSENNIGVTGIKLLTQQNRRAKSGFHRLKFLKLNGNPAIRPNALPHLYTISNLHCILLDKTEILVAALNSKATFFSQCRHSLNFHGNLDYTIKKNVLGCGWAVPVLEQSILRIENRVSNKVNKERRRANGKFYSKTPDQKTVFWSAHSPKNKLSDCNSSVIRNLCMLVCRNSTLTSNTTATKRSNSSAATDENKDVLMQYYLPNSKRKCNYDISKFLE